MQNVEERGMMPCLFGGTGIERARPFRLRTGRLGWRLVSASKLFNAVLDEREGFISF